MKKMEVEMMMKNKKKNEKKTKGMKEKERMIKTKL